MQETFFITSYLQVQFLIMDRRIIEMMSKEMSFSVNTEAYLKSFMACQYSLYLFESSPVSKIYSFFFFGICIINPKSGLEQMVRPLCTLRFKLEDKWVHLCEQLWLFVGCHIAFCLTFWLPPLLFVLIQRGWLQARTTAVGWEPRPWLLDTPCLLSATPTATFISVPRSP